MPALHHTVLDDELDALLPGPIHQRREHFLGRAQVLRDRLPGVATDEGAHGRALEQGRGVDEGGDVVVDRLALGRVGVQVVVVVSQRRQRQPVLAEQRPCVVGLALPEPVDLQVGGGERACAQVGPGCDLQGLEAVPGGPRRDLWQ